MLVVIIHDPEADGYFIADLDHTPLVGLWFPTYEDAEGYIVDRAWTLMDYVGEEA